MSITTKIRHGLAGLLAVCVLVLVACGGSFDGEERQEYIDKCLIEAGPQTDRENAHDYCLAKWRQLQREKTKDGP